MGLDLRLLPFDGDFFSHTILSCERRGDLFDELLAVERRIGRDVPDNFNTFTARTQSGDTGYGKTTDTPYGDRLKCLRAGELIRFAKHDDVRDNATNRAIWAYLSEMDHSAKVALYWH